MVELKFDFPEGDRLSHENYVAVRIGEAQKISRIGSSRIYKFPRAAVGNRRYGRLDILKRVGSCTVCLDGEAADGGNTYHVKIDNAEIDFKTKVSFTDSEKPVEPLPEKKAPERPSNSGKVAAARAYLETHHLEVRISDAMQAVLRERPEDPAAFLAQRLQENAHLVSGLPKPKQADEKVTDELKQSISAELADLVPKHFSVLPSVGSWYKPKPRFPEVSKEANKPAANNTVAAPPTSEPASAPSGSFHTRPSVGTWFMTRSQRAPCLQPAAAPDVRRETSFAKRPSVGTWLGVKPKATSPTVASAASTVAAPVASLSTEAPCTFALRPSVGTWLSARTPQGLATEDQPKMQAAPEEPSPAIFGTQNLMGPTFWSMGLNPSIMCI